MFQKIVPNETGNQIQKCNVTYGSCKFRENKSVIVWLYVVYV